MHAVSFAWAALYAEARGPSTLAGLFIGDLAATGKKPAALPRGDGTYRLLYAMESPECWFEDFGRGKLVRGRARIKLDPQFAQVIRTGDYHVFLTPEGNSHGLYVANRSRTGFEVREQGDGASGAAFSYRIVARRKDVRVRRFERIKLPSPPDAGELKHPLPPAEPPRPLEIPNLPKEIKKALRRKGSSARGAGPRRRPRA